MSSFDWPGDNAELVRQLRIQRSRYEQVVNNMSDLLLLLSPDGQVTFCNRAGPLPPGGSIHPVPGTHMLDCVAERDRQALSAAMEDIRDRRVILREVVFNIPDGSGAERIIEGTFTPILEDDRVTALEFLGRDVTQRHRAAEQLRTTNAELERRQKELQQDLDVATRIHASLLPPPLQTDRVLIDLKHLALLGVGGDYVYIRRDDPLRPALAIFDVSGHGVASALVANRVHSAVYAIMHEGATPANMIERVNRFAYESFAELGMFVTMFAMELDLEAGQACYCGAGHPPALLHEADSGDLVPLESTHLPIGVAANIFVGEPTQTIAIAPGDTIWLYTDGLIELRGSDGEMMGQAGLIERLTALGKVEARPGAAGKFLDSVLADYGSPEDDVTVVLAVVK